MIRPVCSHVTRRLRAAFQRASPTLLFILAAFATEAGAQTRFDNNAPVAIPDVSTIESSIVTSGLTGPISKVTVSLHIVHPWVNDLDIFLLAPDGTMVELSTDNGADGDNYGTSCASRTTFDDAAPASIVDGAAPFAGTFRPEGSLSAFIGKSGAAANGVWRLRITDDGAADVGTLLCWSLIVTAVPIPVQAPTDLRATSIVGNQVTLRWTPAAVGTAPTNYIVEGGVTPGQTLASQPTGSVAPIVTFTAPTGAFYVRVRAQGGASTSGPSNEARIFVAVPAPPSAPGNLQSVAAGSSVGLAWRNTFAGGAPTSLVLDVTGSATTSIPLGLAESASFTGVPAGTYTLRLRAMNAAGTSVPSNSVTITFPAPGCTGVPGTPTSFLTYKIGSTIFAVWDPAAGGAAPTGFVVSVTGSFAGSVSTAGRSLSGPAPPGSYGVSVRATNPCGSSAATPVQTVVIP